MTTAQDQARHDTERALVYAVDHNLIPMGEIGVVAGLAASVKSGRPLVHNDAARAWRVLNRHRATLDAHGITLPAPKTPVTAAPNHLRGDVRPEVAIRADGRIGVRYAPFTANEGLRLGLHATFENRTKEWHLSPTPLGAAGVLALLSGTDPLVSTRVQQLAGEAADAAARRLVLDPSNPPPPSDTLKWVLSPLWEHQLRALEYSSTVSASMIAVPMGGGKTASTVATANKVDASRVLIVCPNKVRGVWPREVAKWSARAWHIVDGKKHARRRNARPQDLTVADRLAEAESCLFDCGCDAAVHAAVFNYEMLVREPVASWVPQLPVDLVIYDEIHRLKSPTGKMSKVAARLVDFSERRIGLSGTPMPQYPWDIFGVYRALDPAIFGHVWTPFKSKYVVTREREGISGKMEEFPVGITPEYKEEFARKVHSIMYRPTVDLKLPGVEHIVREVELEPAARKVYASLDEEMFADLRKFARPRAADARAHEDLLVTAWLGAEYVKADQSEEVEGDDDTDAALTPKNILSRMLRLMQLTGGTVPDDGETDSDGRLVRQSYRVSYAKAEALRDILDEVGCVPGRPNGPEPVVVYCQFRSDLDAIREVAEAAGLEYAEISGRRSDGLSARSEMTEFADVVGVQIQSGGTGVDLTRARYGVWYSAGHSLGDYDQALKRQDRPGQTRPVVFIHLVCADTIDPDVYAGLSRRGSVVGSFLSARGINPAMLGIQDVEIPEETVDRSGRGGASVVLPIDELRPAPWDHVGKGGKRPARTAADWKLLREFEIEDL
jgi:hypothetical protein